MKVAFIIDVFPALSQTFILNQITGLIDLGHEVEIFARTNPNEPKIHSDVEKYRLMERVHYDPVAPRNKIHSALTALQLIFRFLPRHPILLTRTIILLFRRRMFFVRWLVWFGRFFDKRFDIIHSHFGPNGFRALYLREIGLGGKLITTFHGYDVNRYPQTEGKDVYNELFEKCDFFTANSNFTKLQAVKLGCDEKKITVLPMGVRIDKFIFRPREIKPGQRIVILTVGRLVEKKGHQYAVRAIRELITRHQNIVYLIAGDGPLKNRLESLVVELDLQRYVRFPGGLEEDEILEVYRKAHIFVLPSVTASDGDSEGQALVLQEAQAAGIPVVSTFHNGIPDGVLNGESGFLVPERDVDALAEKLEYLIGHPEIWPEMGRCGREFVEKNYNIRRLNRWLAEIYQQLVSGQ